MDLSQERPLRTLDVHPSGRGWFHHPGRQTQFPSWPPGDFLEHHVRYPAEFGRVRGFNRGELGSSDRWRDGKAAEPAKTGEAWLAEVKRLRKGITLGGTVTVRQLIDEGRKY